MIDFIACWFRINEFLQDIWLGSLVKINHIYYPESCNSDLNWWTIYQNGIASYKFFNKFWKITRILFLCFSCIIPIDVWRVNIYDLDDHCWSYLQWVLYLKDMLDTISTTMNILRNLKKKHSTVWDFGLNVVFIFQILNWFSKACCFFINVHCE